VGGGNKIYFGEYVYSIRGSTLIFVNTFYELHIVLQLQMGMINLEACVWNLSWRICGKLQRL